MYEYKFVRLGERRILGVRPTAEDEYQKIVHEHAKEGWRLVQIFAPGLNPYGRAIYFELIFEREVKA